MNRSGTPASSRSVRPATPDHLPLIGPWPDIEGLWIATGHEGLGITTATATAALLSVAHTPFRRSVSGDPRAPLSGMGTCFECRAPGPHVRSCLAAVREGMEVQTDG